MVSILCYSKLLLGLNLQPPDDLTQKYFPTKHLIQCANSEWILMLIHLMSPSSHEILLSPIISDFFFPELLMQFINIYIICVHMSACTHTHRHTHTLTHTHIYVYIYPITLQRVGCDKRSIFKYSNLIWIQSFFFLGWLLC